MRKLLIIGLLLFSLQAIAGENSMNVKVANFPVSFKPIECKKHRLPVLRVYDESGDTVKAEASFSPKTGLIMVAKPKSVSSETLTIKQDCHLNILYF